MRTKHIERRPYALTYHESADDIAERDAKIRFIQERYCLDIVEVLRQALDIGVDDMIDRIDENVNEDFRLQFLVWKELLKHRSRVRQELRWGIRE